MQQFENLISNDSIDKVFNLFHTSTNQVEIDNAIVDRHAPSSIGHFMVSKFTIDEFNFLWDEIKDTLSDYKLVYCRVLKYNKGCGIPLHTDSYTQGQNDSDYSLIIQMNDPDSYAGGHPSVNSQKFYLKPGDAVMYTYSEEHGVDIVRKGIRYVVNLRLKKVK